MKTLQAILILLLIAVCGCTHYQSKFVVAGNQFTLPKDAKFDWLQVSIPGTNGPITLVISNGIFRMNPEVLTAQTSHDTALIKATAAAVGEVMGQAAGTMLKP